MRRFFSSAMILLSSVVAMAAGPGDGGLPAAFRASKRSYQPVTADTVARKQKAALDALSYFESVLRVSKGEADGWITILGLPAVRKQLDLGMKADPEAIETISYEFFQDRAGIEHPAVLALRSAIVDFQNAVLFANLENGADVFEKTVEELAGWIEKHGKEPTAETSYQVGKRLGWLTRGGQLPALVRATHARFSQPSFRLRIAKSYIQHNFEKNINDTSPVNQTIRGAQVLGTATTVGKTELELVPSDNGAVIRVVMNGLMTSHNVATKTVPGLFKRPIHVTVPSTGHSTLRVEKDFILNGDTVTPVPARASVQTSTTFHSVQSDARLRMVRGKVVEGAYADKPLGEAEGARQTEAILRQKADEAQQPSSFQDTVKLYKEYLQTPQVRSGSAPVATIWSSQPSYLQQNVYRYSVDTLGAATLPPAAKGTYHFTVFAHQSEANNLIGPMYRGRWVSDDDFGTILKIVFGYTPKEFRLGSHMPRWTVKMDKIRPIAIEFGDQTATATLYAQSYKLGDETVQEAFSASAKYAISMSEHGPELTRIGEVSVLPGEGTAKLSDKTKAFVAKKFGDLFGKNLAPDGLVPPDGGKFEELRAYSIVELTAKDGWMVVGIDEDKTKLKKKD